MKKWIKKSFHRQLLVCFGVVALLPLLLFGVFLIQTMETKINSDYEKKVTEQAEQIDAGILELFQEFEMVVENINANTRIVEQIGEDDTWSKSKIYLQFYREWLITENMPNLICMIKTENVFTLRHREVPRQICRYTGAS